MRPLRQEGGGGRLFECTSMFFIVLLLRTMLVFHRIKIKSKMNRRVYEKPQETQNITSKEHHIHRNYGGKEAEEKEHLNLKLKVKQIG